jgi:cysteine-rich repeat protein
MLMQGTASPFTMLAYAGDGVNNPQDGAWSYHPATRRITVNPVGSATAAAEVFVPHYSFNVHMLNPTAYVTLQYLTLEGTRGRSIEAHGTPAQPVTSLILRGLVQRYVPRHFILANPAPSLLVEDNLAEYGCRGVSWALSSGDGCFGYRVFRAHNAIFRRNVLRHLGASGRRKLSGGATGWDCAWCDAPWNSFDHTDVSTFGTAFNIKQTSSAVLEDNVVEDVLLEGIALDVSRGVTVQRNFIRRARGAIGMRDFTPTPGCPTTSTSEYCFNQDHVIRSNIVDSSGSAPIDGICAVSIHGHDRRHTGTVFLARLYNNFISRSSVGAVCAHTSEGARSVTDLAVWNNTIWGEHPILGSERPAAGIVLREPTRNVELRNNVLSQVGGDAIVLSTTALAGMTLDGDLIHAQGGCAVRWNLPDTGGTGGTCSTLASFRTSNPGQETRAIVGDPRFMAPTAAIPNLHVAAGSAAIDAGVAVPNEVSSDADGDPRPLGVTWDAGADESETCGDGIPQAPEQCDDGNAIDGDGCDSNCTRTGCANGIVTAGEQCDDGNTARGDCCDERCRFEASGTPCDDGIICTNADVCTAGGCQGTAAPSVSCRTAGAGSVLLQQGSGTSPDLLMWRWKNGPTTMLPELGDPVSGGTTYTMCAYDTAGATGRLVLAATVRPGDICNGTPCWKRLGSGYRYRLRARSSPERMEFVVKTDTRGRAKIALKRKGQFVSDGWFPIVQEPRVTVQLMNDAGVCWETTHLSPPVRADDFVFADVQD